MSLAACCLAVFWSCAGLIAYSYAFYGPLVWGLSRWRGRRNIAPDLSDDDFPSISLLIVAHNEETVIGRRLGNALAVDYPRDRLEVVVASDASSDRTPAIVREFAARGVRLIEFVSRQGKAAAINRAIPQLQGQLIVLSDANTDFDVLAARKLARWFHDPAVGVVCGRLVLADPRTGRNVDSLYWRYETILKQCESRLGGLLGANGAIYAVHRSFFTPVPDGTIVDDLVIPLVARLRHRCTILYDPEAIAREETPADLREEFRRRARIGAGCLESLPLLWPLLNPRWGFVAFAFFSHKILRWLCPFFLIGLLGSSLALANRPFYAFAVCAQLTLYAIAGAALFAPPRLTLPTCLAVPAMFFSMNAALLAGFYRWLRPRSPAAWTPTARTPCPGRESR